MKDVTLINCKNCVFWLDDEKNDEATAREDEGFGICKLFPAVPTLDNGKLYQLVPFMHKDDWCGQAFDGTNVLGDEE
ncbi:hypothetical protein DRO91_08790 [Candidatus Heimdallarchaeota archaeon]|nr:MAG: hypothetical protein DRO91_08790 [Candidatus Heimdallarchaeota archaeon]